MPSTLDAPVDVVVVGAGIVGLAAARALARDPSLRLAVLEAEARPATHQTGRNSGVLHAGLYYAPGSLKAALCRRGRAAMRAFCEERRLPLQVRGKLVVARGQDELPRLRRLAERGAANGVAGLRRLDAAELAEREPSVSGVAALLVPETALVDFAAVARQLARELEQAGHLVATGRRLLGARPRADGLVLTTTAGDLPTRGLLACAGLQADRVARSCGLHPGLAILPVRGEYHELAPARAELVRHCVYPVPDPAFPFLGLHLTPTLDGRLELGPNAVLSPGRHGDARRTPVPRDLAAMLGHGGIRRLLRRHWRLGLAEWWRARHPARVLEEARRMLPDLELADLRPSRAGVRAQAVTPQGELLDDFHVVEGPGQVHVLNAPSPAATASLAIGEHLATRLRRVLGLGEPAPPEARG